MTRRADKQWCLPLRVGDYDVALPTADIRAVAACPPVAPLPGLRPFVRGLGEVEGRATAVLDLYGLLTGEESLQPAAVLLLLRDASAAVGLAVHHAGAPEEAALQPLGSTGAPFRRVAGLELARGIALLDGRPHWVLATARLLAVPPRV